ncbi:MAG: hypothetical protein RID91_16180, partial [Azospirillaceae bacterium]
MTVTPEPPRLEETEGRDNAALGAPVPPAAPADPGTTPEDGTHDDPRDPAATGPSRPSIPLPGEATAR